MFARTCYSLDLFMYSKKFVEIISFKIKFFLNNLFKGKFVYTEIALI